MTGLYVHIPFCRRKCHYCDFVIAISGPGGRHDAFLDALEKEAEYRSLRTSGVVFETVYLGGGTPSTLDAKQITRLFEILKKNFRWKKNAEVTCEINPGDVDSRMADLLLKLGVNRASLGAQTFREETLAEINRAHTAEQIETSFHILKGSGFHNINMDLILSLPGETWLDVHNSLQKTVALGPQHISLYELTIEPKTVFGDRHRRGTLNLPDEDMQFEILSKARLFLKEAGLRHYELLNYARPGFESHHNLLYWANENYLGLGAGAWSYLDGVRYRFAESYEQYLAKITNEIWENAEEDTITDEKKERESLLLALRLTEGALVSRFESLLTQCEEEISSLVDRGLVERDSERIWLSPQGQLLAETVFTELSKP